MAGKLDRRKMMAEMKRLGRILIVATPFFITTSISAMDCVEFSIEDHGDHMEAVCVGKSQAGTTRNVNSAREYKPPPQAETQPLRELPQNTTVNSCKFLQANHYDVGRNPNVEVEVGCEVTGRASQYVEFLLHGLSSSGEKLVTTAFNGYFNADGTADLKKTFPVEYGKFINARKWEPDRSNSSVLIAKGYIFNEKDLLLRTTEIKKEISERELQSSGSWSNRDYIAMRKGVNFSHGLHQRRYDCATCHKNTNGGSISGFGKGWAHKTCKGCHSDRAEGPTSCKGCHKS